MTRCALLVAAAACALSGCGTMDNVRGEPPENAVLGGVRINADRAWSCAKASFFTHDPASVVLFGAIGAYSLALDLPLSAVADTLTLPITIPAALKKSEEPKSQNLPAESSP